MGDVTRLLDKIESGDRAAAEQLLPVVYQELRRLASAKFANEKPGQTLHPTALVHEAYLRLVGNQQFEGRGIFLLQLRRRFAGFWLNRPGATIRQRHRSFRQP